MKARTHNVSRATPSPSTHPRSRSISLSRNLTGSSTLRSAPCWVAATGSVFFVCNPVTTLVARLDLKPPSCPDLTRLYGFNRHGPSSEPRLLVLANEPEPGLAAHYVYSLAAVAAATSSQHPCRLGPVADGVVVHEFAYFMNHYAHHRGKIHWTIHPLARNTQKILAFDTVSEDFRLMSRPPWPRDPRRRCPPLPPLLLHDRVAVETPVSLSVAHPRLCRPGVAFVPVSVSDAVVRPSIRSAVPVLTPPLPNPVEIDLERPLRGVPPTSRASASISMGDFLPHSEEAHEPSSVITRPWPWPSATAASAFGGGLRVA
ncbi:hypothetical protein ZWY2020_052334 [Hordeum vulgare]|nr:hypothetical protein ZWY2020_052334 [Hordeum vulgare]